MAISNSGLSVLKNDIYFAFRQLRQSAFSTSESPISIEVTSFFRELVQGKWAKNVAGLKGLGSNANTAIQERIRCKDLLKKKIAGQGSDHSDEDETDSDFDSEAKGALPALTGRTRQFERCSNSRV
ncbi:hypothetical protein PCASD_00609 [Puccinia coronata f. sp. avenae]|uniref:Uncharacterized protein n=1 Tax=Puccinia coronata f. sp. avenae TaxID=200324 RepID=A0A2N5VNW3_9BASI|nr:hypothetical protein PCASD_00609 [Puccinia coronata f. sp. avenae]